MDFKSVTFRTRDGLTLYYRDYNSAPPGRLPVLCLHGLTRNSADFSAIADHLAPHRRVVAPDMRGRGRSARDPVAAHYNPGVYVEDVRELLAHAGLEKVVVIGTSMGGMMAMMMAANRPAGVAGVVLNDIGPQVEEKGIRRISGFVGRTAAAPDWARAAAAIRVMNQAFYPDFTEADWLAMARRTFREQDGVIRPDYDPAIGEVVRAGGAAPADMWSLYEALKPIPTLVIRGGLSDVLSARTVAEMAARKPDLGVLELANRGHVPLLDEPACLAAIDDFLARRDASAPPPRR
jgi:pimeloyl-ACP methyl ester carboxylesterase